MTARVCHIGLNLIFLVPGETGGMEVYARELIPALLEQAPEEMQFTAFINRETAAADEAWRTNRLAVVTVPVNARSRVQWVAGEQTLLPPLAARRSVDVLHSLASTSPLWGPFKRVTTVHDLIYARFPDAHSGLRKKGMRVLVPAAVRRSQRIIADSLATRGDLIELLGTPAGKIDVAPLGLPTVGREPGLPEAEIRTRLDLGSREVLLSLSAKRPHKNLLALIDALAQIPSERRPLLVIPGYGTWYEAELRARAVDLDVDRDVRMPHWLSAAELEGLWACTRVFVFPSLCEGFGLPVLEAMARGVPVACSNASSLPEVAGDAAVMFDPHDVGGIAHAIEELLTQDDSTRARMMKAGIEQARQFTWRRTARATLDSYARVLGERP